ncbi:MAG: hypothetical protein O2960_25495 [Verrucomicrobia bacterium]|nr:hypothetical protein [Verrucomicrobiota bacterium]
MSAREKDPTGAAREHASVTTAPGADDSQSERHDAAEDAREPAVVLERVDGNPPERETEEDRSADCRGGLR